MTAMTRDHGDYGDSVRFRCDSVRSRRSRKTPSAQTKSHPSMGCLPTQARLLLATVLIAVSWSPVARAQPTGSPNLMAPASAQGRLTVTATVVSSVGVIIGPDGQPMVIVANAPSPGDILSASLCGSQRSMVARERSVFVPVVPIPCRSGDPVRFRRSTSPRLRAPGR